MRGGGGGGSSAVSSSDGVAGGPTVTRLAHGIVSKMILEILAQ